MPTSPCSLSCLRAALNNLYDHRFLRTSPLVHALGAPPAADAPGHLRRVLVQAIESLKPEPNVPPQSPAQRVYEILYYRYVQQCSQDEVAEQLGLGIRQLKREQRKALEVLAGRLREQHGIEIDLHGDTDGEGIGPAGEESVATPWVELQWLEEAPGSEPVELNAILPAVLDLVQPIASRYRVRLQTAAGTALPLLAVDAVALRQMLLSLLCVAIRRTAGGKVTIAAQTANWHVDLRIHGSTHQSPGDPAPEDAANLATARQLAEACGASLALTSAKGPFAATISLSAVDRVPVLVIDDNADTLRLLQRYAACTRYHIVGAQNAEQALALAQETTPQAIVLDIMMPRIDGWELLRRFQRLPATSDIPVLACTILAQEELATSLGVQGFLRKPISRRAFLSALDNLFPPPTS